MSAIRFKFSANERLKREQDIQTLFQNGKAFSYFPIKCIWLQVSRDKDLSPMKLAVSVPKKRISKAVHRNDIKRRCKESWRLNKHLLINNIAIEKQLRVFLIYTGPHHPSFEMINQAVVSIIIQLNKNLS